MCKLLPSCPQHPRASWMNHGEMWGVGRSELPGPAPLTYFYFIGINPCVLIVGLDPRSPGWVRECPAHARLWLPAEAWGAQTQPCHVCQPHPWLRHSEITADFFRQNPNTISAIHHQIKTCFPIPGRSSGKRPSWHLCSALMRVTLPRGCPGALQHPGAASFLQVLLSNLPSAHPQLLMHTGSVLAVCPSYVSKLKSHQCSLSEHQFYVA